MEQALQRRGRAGRAHPVPPVGTLRAGQWQLGLPTSGGVAVPGGLPPPAAGPVGVRSGERAPRWSGTGRWCLRNHGGWVVGPTLQCADVAGDACGIMAAGLLGSTNLAMCWCCWWCLRNH